MAMTEENAMTPRRMIPAALLLASVAAAPAFAEEVIVYTTPATTTYYYTQPATTYYYTPSLAEIYTPTTIEVVEERPRVIVTAPALTEDEAINRDVVDTLASNPRLSGRIGVETRNNTVELSGRVATPGQVRIAERDAKSVPGVREVQSQLRPSVGGSY
jgi:hypothetical protein